MKPIIRNPAYSGNYMAGVITQDDIAADTLQGLTSLPKFLSPKYFYDDNGSAIFREIMDMPEYYITSCERRILTEYSAGIVSSLCDGASFLNLIEPGSGDGSKTLILLKALAGATKKFRFIPVDISNKANETLKNSILTVLPGIDVSLRTGDYFHMFDNPEYPGEGRNVILFLGSNIGNLNNSELDAFLGNISGYTVAGDKLLIGFDLKKSPGIIMKAYDDPHGLTKKFNLNLLIRLNRELSADFDTSLFEHHTEYNPVTGELRSFLVSTVRHTVHVGALGETIHFRQWEPLFMELSRKFDLNSIDALAVSHGFRVERNYTDSRRWFVDSLWTRT